MIKMKLNELVDLSAKCSNAAIFLDKLCHNVEIDWAISTKFFDTNMTQIRYDIESVRSVIKGLETIINSLLDRVEVSI